MAWVTEIRADEQVDYRLGRQAGCGVVDDAEAEIDAPADQVVDYRLAADADGVLVWVGSGLDDVGLMAGAALNAEGEAAAKRLMKGAHPQTGARLIKSKTSVRADRRATLTVAPVLRAIEARAAEEAVDLEALFDGKPYQLSKMQQQQRMVEKKGEAQRLPVQTLHKLARAAGVDLTDVYGESELATAWAHKDMRIDSRVRGWDLVLDLPKSDSLLAGLMSEADEKTYRALVHQAKDETLRALEGWIGYAVGSEDAAPVRLATGGLLGWSVEHRAARPMGDGQPGDPHLHLHVVVANMGLCEDGEWRSIANSGRDLYRHASAADAFFKARVRALTAERFGVRRTQAEASRAWEVDGIPEQLRDRFSRRAALVDEQAGEEATLADRLRVSAETRRAKHAADAAGMRESWRQRAETAGVDVDAMVAAAAPGPDGPQGGAGIDGPPGPRIPPGDVAAVVFHPETGVTASKKSFSRAELLAAVANALPDGIGPEARDLERLVDDVLRVDGYAVALLDTGSTVMSSTARYTTRDVLDAEDVAVTQAQARFGDGTVKLTEDQAAAAMSVFAVAAGFELSAQQREVVTRLLTAGHGIDAVVGVAGAGKSTLMDACRIAWDATGTTYAGACLSAVGAQGLQEASAIPSRTVAAWLQRIDSGEGLTGVDVLVVDEATMTDDRSAAKLLTEAARTGTQVIAIGDPLQLQAVGIGGWFAEVHRLVDGLTLTENRRQLDESERAALEVWRTGDHHQALELLAAGGRVHAVETADDARSEMLMTWDELRRQWPQELDLLEHLVVLAARNGDVDLLNAGAQQIRRAAGELGTEHTYALPGGATLTLAEGDVVRVRVNDYRSRRGQGPDVLNGYRGTITAIDDAHRVEVTWRAKNSQGSGTNLVSAWFTPDDVAAGALSLGYAMTVAASQGMTCHTSLLYGHGCNAYATYPGLTRGRAANHLWLPLAVVEDERTQAALGAARSETERLQRAVRAFADFLGQSRPDGMVSDELRAAPEPVTVPRQVDRVPSREETEAALRAARDARDDMSRAVSGSAARSRSTWETRRRWEQAAEAARQARQQGQEQDPERTRPWRERPYGDLSDVGLRQTAARYLDLAETCDRTAQEAQERHRQLAERLAQERAEGATRGQKWAAAADKVLARSEELVARAREASTDAETAGKTAASLRSQIAHMERVRKTGHVRLLLSLTTKGAVQRDLDDLVALRIAAEEARDKAARLYSDATREAWKNLADSEHGRSLGAGEGHPPRDLEAVERRVQEMRRLLPQRAQAKDVRDLRQLGAANGEATKAAADARDWREAAALVRKEQGIRQTLRETSPLGYRMEAKARATHIAEQQHRQAEQIRQQNQAASSRYEPPAPSRGRGMGL
ncbi:MobF family relaxase [Streptomyces sp. UH6]|uniref:MobF family relaxase n=1 Tax=Streptomyces sp. UH6 TaxID=2748379 RepID=UPI0015D4FE3E|nr:MobF family relaxase [Streptomyces sp. UH6]NYV74528.1 relaxase domain-containing protein [Streptomyces sp. UH6]